MKAVLYQMPDGHVERLWLAPQAFDPSSTTRAELRARGIDFNTDDEVIAYIIRHNVPAVATKVTVLEESELPKRTEGRAALALKLK